MVNISKEISQIYQWLTKLVNESYVQMWGHPCIHTQETGWKSGVRSCIMPGLPANLVQELNVGTVNWKLMNSWFRNYVVQRRHTHGDIAPFPWQPFWSSENTMQFIFDYLLCGGFLVISHHSNYSWQLMMSSSRDIRWNQLLRLCLQRVTTHLGYICRNR